MSVQLLKTKQFIPTLPDNHIIRSELFHRLNSNLDRRISIIAAPAGFGKTTFASSWVRQVHNPVVWVSLDESDNDPAVFWAYVINGLQAVDSHDGNPLFDRIDINQLPDHRTLLIQFINELSEITDKVIIVLDDYHVISNPQIHDDIAYIVDHQPQTLHILLITRLDPPLPLARLRGNGFLTEIRSRDLRFTVEEENQFLNGLLNLGLCQDDIVAIDHRTEGWIIGLCLTALSMKNRQDRGTFVASFSESNYFILEYLTEEVLDQLPEKIRVFLLKLAVLDQFNVPLCRQVTGMEDSHLFLEELVRQNLFLVPLDNERVWFRFHHLFKDLLNDRLQKDISRQEISGMYMAASRWYCDQNDHNEAIKYALLAGDFQQAAGLIEQVVDQVISRGQVKTLLRWMDVLPEEIVKTSTRLLLHQSWVVFLTGNVTQAEKILEQAKISLNTKPDGSEKDLLHGRLLAIEATITSLSRNLLLAISQADEALRLLPNDAWIYRARATRAKGVASTFLGEMDEAISSLEKAKSLAIKGESWFLASEICSQIATARKHQGKLSQAADAYQQILNFYRQPEQTAPACLGYIGLAEIALERNEQERAQQLIETGLALCFMGNIGYALQPACLIKGLIDLAQGNKKSARESISKGENLSRSGGGSLESILGLAMFETRLCLQAGNMENARQWANGELIPAGWSFEDLPVTLWELHQSLVALVELQSDRFERVLEICDRILPGAENCGRLGRVIELNLYRALSLYHLGKEDKALESLSLCLDLAEPEGYMRMFITAGKGMDDLLDNAIEKNVHADFARRLLPHFPGRKDFHVIAIHTMETEVLTERETEVLRYLCRGYSNQEIAEELIVSVNTIKKFTSNIYGKLGVSNRTQEILKAQEADLIRLN